jgi:hypothetical protein
VESKPFKERKIGMMDLMKYYNPKWLAAIAFFISIITSFAYPVLGIIFSKLLFLSMTDFLPDFEQ